MSRVSQSSKDDSTGEGFQANVSGNIVISERVLMTLLSILLSTLSFGGGYTYGSQNVSPHPSHPVQGTSSDLLIK
jgi:hypothetical protein